MTEPVVVPPRKYAFTYIGLMALFAATFALAHVDLGSFNIVVSLLIAGTKALLVALYFMHLRYSGGMHRVAAGLGIFWLGILVVLAITDYISRAWLLLPNPWPPIWP